MPSTVRAVLFALVAASVAVGFEEARSGITADGILAHLYFLSQDELGGRAPGSRGGDLAAEYIKAQFIRMGLEPVSGGYFQEVPLVGFTPDTALVGLAFRDGENAMAARYPEDAVIWPVLPEPVSQLSGELVFVGYGIEAPEWDWDDFEGEDLAGSVALFLVGDPPAPPEEAGLFDGRAMTYYGRWTYKFEEARKRGAIGALIVHTDAAAGYGWDVVRTSWTGEHLLLADADPSPLRLQGWVTLSFARRLLGASGIDLAQLYVQAARRDFRPVRTGVTVQASLPGRIRRVRTRNVVGYRPGSDSIRGGQVVLFTSHYDHLGIGPPVNGDSIYNGAYDNASGVSLLLEVAGAFARLDPAPARSALFIATTGEEAGLLGAEHYVRRPLVPLRRTVAAINVDGANLWGETDDIVALQADGSTLGTFLRPRAQELGMQVLGDPEPEKGGFFRSDHFPFARLGIPVLYLRHGVDFRGRPNGWGPELMERWAALHYHQPSDELAPNPDLSGAVQQARLVFAVGYDVANSDIVPTWLPSSPFRAAQDRLRR